MKVIYSNSNFGKILILNILLQFELWMYFQCLLNSNYRMKWKLILHHDFCHYNVHTWWNFQIFWNNFLFDVIFLHFFFKNSQKNQFSTKKSKNLVKQKRHVISYLKNTYRLFHIYLVAKWQQTKWLANKLEINGHGLRSIFVLRAIIETTWGNNVLESFLNSIFTI